MKQEAYFLFRKKFDDSDSLNTKIDLLWAFAEIYWDTFRTELSELLENELKDCIRKNHLDGEIIFRVLLSRIYADSMRFDLAIEHVKEVRSKIHLVTNKKVVAYSKVFFSIMEMYMGNYDAAFDLTIQARNEYEGIDKDHNYGWCFYTAAIIYFDLKDYSNALENYKAGLDHFEKIEYRYGIARCKTGIGSVKIKNGELSEAESLYLSAANTFQDLGVSSGISRVYNDLAELYKRKKEFNNSKDFLEKAIKIRRETQHWQGLATSLIEMGDVLTFLNENDEAIEYLNEAIIICTKINNRYKLSNANHLLYLIRKKNNQLDLAIEHLEEFHRLKNEISNVESNNKIKSLEKKMAAEKAEKETELERIKNNELKLAFDIIEEKNKEILDSINYARRIQYTLLASDEVLKKYLPEHFVLFQPKDIVSGDFYWFSHGENENVFYLAVCDSTGHGVPGAFMSLLNITYLNEAINEKHISEPGKILDYVREKLIKNVSQDGAKDGMDATLLKFNVQPFDQAQGKGLKLEIRYAAAHNSPFVVRNGECLELLFDKMPVGKGELTHSFSTYEIPLEKGDMIYLCTDGYSDQFGGEKFGVKKAGGKKFKKSNLKKLLVEIANSKSHIQNSKLSEAFTQWKGDLEQVDDVCIIGIRV